MGKVLIIYHSLGGNTKAAAEAVADGVRQAGAEASIKDGLVAGVEDLIGCQTLAVGTPDYFSYMAGGVKDFFDRTLYPVQGKVTDKPVGIFVTHGGGGEAVESVKNICRSFKFRLACAPVLVRDRPDKESVAKLQEMGQILGKLAQA